MKVLVLGAGKMVQAILSGLQGIEDLSEWQIYSPSGTSAEKVAAEVGARFIKNFDEVLGPEFVLVGCKPQQLEDLKKTIGNRFDELPFISLLAAASEKVQREILGKKELIRCMPNLPVQFRKGVILLSSDSAPHRLKFYQSFFSKLGHCLSVTEKELDELTLLTGSGPALFYEFTGRLAESFHSLDSIQREILARAVFIGTSKTLEKGDESLVELTDKVTSKGGVTIAVLEAWRKMNFYELICKGVEEGIRRIAEIKEETRN